MTTRRLALATRGIRGGVVSYVDLSWVLDQGEVGVNIDETVDVITIETVPVKVSSIDFITIDVAIDDIPISIIDEEITVVVT